jgi:hypothetical protein
MTYEIMFELLCRKHHNVQALRELRSLGTAVIKGKRVGFEGLTSMAIKNTTFWDVTPYSLVNFYQTKMRNIPKDMTCLHCPLHGNGSINTFPRQQICMQQ